MRFGSDMLSGCNLRLATSRQLPCPTGARCSGWHSRARSTCNALPTPIPWSCYAGFPDFDNGGPNAVIAGSAKRGRSLSSGVSK